MCVSLSFYLLSEKLLNDTNQITVVKQMLWNFLLFEILYFPKNL